MIYFDNEIIDMETENMLYDILVDILLEEVEDNETDERNVS